MGEKAWADFEEVYKLPGLSLVTLARSINPHPESLGILDQRQKPKTLESLETEAQNTENYIEIMSSSMKG